MKIIYSILILLFFSVELFCADSVLVQVGNINITADEFKYRYELMPQPYSSGIDNQTKKRNFLYSIIAEKLWALEAENAGLDTSEIINSQYRAVEKMYVRDALYKLEITNNIKITPEEIQTDAARALIKLHLKAIESNNSELIIQIYKSLNEGASVDSIIKQKNIKINEIEVSYGQLQPLYEDVVYNLRAGEYSPPLKTETGSLIFQLVKTEKLPSPGMQQLIQKSEKQIRERKEDSLYYDFMNSIFLSKEVSASGTIIQKLGDLIYEIFKKKNENSADSVFNLNARDITNLKQNVGSELLNAEFINIKNSPLSTEEFLDYLQFETITVSSVDRDAVLFALNSRIKNVIELEILAGEAYRRGLQNLPEVKNELKIWRESYLAKILQQQKADSSIVSDEEVNRYISSNNDGFAAEPQVIFIKSDDLDVMNEVLNKLQSGDDFTELAEKYSRHENDKSAGNEDIKKIALQMKEGEVYGPVKTGSEYLIFKVVNNAGLIDTLNKSAKNMEDIRRSLSYKRIRENFIDYTVKLADKYGLKINEELYKTVKLNDWKVVTFRYMGFGGVINAVPYVFPFYEWSYVLEKQDKKIP